MVTSSVGMLNGLKINTEMNTSVNCNQILYTSIHFYLFNIPILYQYCTFCVHTTLKLILIHFSIFFITVWQYRMEKIVYTKFWAQVFPHLMLCAHYIHFQVILHAWNVVLMSQNAFYLKTSNLYSRLYSTILLSHIKNQLLKFATWAIFSILSWIPVLLSSTPQTYVHGHSSNFRPAVSLCLVFEVSPASLQHGFVNTTTSGNNTCHKNTFKIRGLK